MVSYHYLLKLGVFLVLSEDVKCLNDNAYFNLFYRLLAPPLIMGRNGKRSSIAVPVQASTNRKLYIFPVTDIFEYDGVTLSDSSLLPIVSWRD